MLDTVVVIAIVVVVVVLITSSQSKKLVPWTPPMVTKKGFFSLFKKLFVHFLTIHIFLFLEKNELINFYNFNCSHFSSLMLKLSHCG